MPNQHPITHRPGRPPAWIERKRYVGQKYDVVRVHYSHDRPPRPDLDRVARWTLERRERGAWTVVESYDGGRP